MWPTSTLMSGVRRLRVVTLAVVVSFAFLVTVGAEPAFAQPGDQNFSVRMAEQEVHGYHWVQGFDVTIDIDDPATLPNPDWSDTQLALPPDWDPTMGFVQFQPFIDDFVIESGFLVTMTQVTPGGTFVETHTVTELTIIGVYPDTDVVTGTGADVSLVHVNFWGDPGSWRNVTVSGGIWTADFGVAGDGQSPADIGLGSQGEAYQDAPDGNNTQFSWRVPNPGISVETPNSVWSINDGWVPGRTVTVTVDDDDIPGNGFLHQQTAVVESWGPSPWDAGWNIGNLAFDIEPDHYVTADDGVEVSKTLQVVDLTVTSLDETADVVSGTAPPGALVEVYACEEFACGNRSVVAEGTGVWIADFSVPGTGDHEQDVIAIQPGFGGAAQIYDSDGDSTHRGWQLHDPYFGVDVANEEMWAADWPAGETLTFQVFADDTMADLLWTDTMTAYGTPWQNTEAGYRFWSEFDVQGGQYFTVSDGVTTKDLVVSTLSIIDVDPSTDVYTGTVDPTVPADVTTDVCAWARQLSDPNQSVQLCDLPDSIGKWTIDFAGVGDIIPGDHLGVSQRDADGDETSQSWGVPPWIYVELAETDEAGVDLYPDRIHLDQWTGPVDIYLNGGLAMSGVVTNGDSVQVDLDVEIGQTIRVVDGIDDKSLDIKLLTVDDVTAWDAPVQPSTAFGRADVPDNSRQVQVTASADYGWWTERWVPVLSGEYQADFANPGNGWRESEIGYFGEGGADDIYLGGEVRANLWDFDNDQVQAIWHTCNPRIIIVRGNDRIEAVCFPVGSELVVEIDDPAFAGVEWTSGDPVVVTRDPDKPWETLVVLELGDYTAPDGAAVTATATEEGVPVVVVTTEVVAFSVDEIDELLDTVTGTAPAGSEVLVETNGHWRYPIADEFNTWVADFSVPGDQPGEENSVDLVPGTDGSATLVDEAGSATTVLWRISNTRFDVDAGFDWVSGGEWLPNASVDVSINGVPHSSWSTDGSGNFGDDWDPFGTDLVSGDLVEVTDGETTKSHIVTPLAVAEVNPDTDVISGIATPDATISVGIYGPAGIRRSVLVDPFGGWSVDFAGQHDLVAGDNGDANECDSDGDCSYASWLLRFAYLHVDAGFDWVSGGEWLPNASVDVSINGVPHSSWSTDGSGNFGDDWDPFGTDLVSGDLVEVTDGETTKSHIVTPLAVAEVNPDTDVISGIATPDATISVGIYGPAGIRRSVLVDPFGGWSVDFAGQHDLVAGDNGDANECDSDGDCSYASWLLRFAYLHVDAGFDWVSGGEWLPNASVDVSINGVPHSSWSTDGSGNFGDDWDPFGTDLVSGDLVEVTDGETTKSHIVTPLAVAEVNPDTDVISGIATPDATISVGIYGPAGIRRSVLVDPFGGWSVDFAGQHDLVAGDNGDANECDSDGDCSYASWLVRDPQFNLDPHGDWLWGQQWLPNASIDIWIDGVLVAALPTDESGNFGETETPMGIDFVAGMLIGITDGETTKTHTITPLSITNADPGNDVITGTATPDASIDVWFHDARDGTRVQADAAGNWIADFAGVHDLRPGESGPTSECDADGDCTYADWWISNPVLNVDAQNDGVWGHEWLPDGSVAITIDGSEHSTLPTDEWGNFGEGWDPLGIDIISGMLIEVTDGVSTESLAVTPLAVTHVDPDTDEIFGIATPDAAIDVWIHDTEVGYTVAVDPFGDWSVDTSADHDLVPGDNGNSSECDEDGDCTYAGWWIAQAQFHVSPAHDGMSGGEWLPNVALSITVDDGTGPVAAPGGPYSTDELGDFYIEFDRAELDVAGGDLVTVSDGATTKAHTVTDLAITGVDPDTDRVLGVAAPGSDVDVWVHDTDAWRHVVANALGDWVADFTASGIDEPEHEYGTADLETGWNGNSGQCDDDNDCTNAHWRVPQPQFWVTPAEESISIAEFLPNAELSITVNGVAVSGGPHWTDEWGNYGIGFDWAELDLTGGDLVEVSDAATTKTHTVTDLAITAVDPDLDQVFGVAAPGSEVHVWVHDPDVQRNVVAGPDRGDGLGVWVADFTAAGIDEPGDQGNADLEVGSNGNSIQCDDDDDCTNAFWWIEELEVDIDIKPGSDTNPVNLKSKGVIPVAILTTNDFDATSVDPLSVVFGPAEVAEAHGRGHLEDVDHDGDIDLVLHFRTQETGIQASDTEACLTGATFQGQTIAGCDLITVTGRRK